MLNLFCPCPGWGVLRLKVGQGWVRGRGDAEEGDMGWLKMLEILRLSILLN